MASVGVRRKPQHLQVVTPEEELENLRNEVGALRRAVESKSAAVGILRSELQECQKERDNFRTLAEQGSSSIFHRTPVLSPTKHQATLSDPGRSAMISGGDGTSLAQLLCHAKEESRALRQESAELRCRLHDAQADIKVLRAEVQRWQGGGEGRRSSQANTALTQLALQEREHFISQMEELSAKCQALEGDVRGLVEEREELVRELDATHHKLHRLNYILNTVLSNPHCTPTTTITTTNTTTTTTVSDTNSTTATAAPTPPKRIIDLDAIITENRYLQQRLKQAEEDVSLARSNSSKYKAALERCRTQGSVKLGTSESLIVTPKQVSELLQEYRGEMVGSAESDLRSLCVALVDALGQRSRALRTQRSANRVLVDRVNELERRLVDKSGHGANSGEDCQKGEVANHTYLPIAAQELMEGYTPPAGRGGLTYVKEEDASRDPRLAKLIEPLIASQLPSHTRDSDREGNGECEAYDVNEAGKEGVDFENQTLLHNEVSDDNTNHKCKMSKKDERGSGPEDQNKDKDVEIAVENEELKECTPLLLDTMHAIQTCTDDALEEIVPLDQLDAYMKEVHTKRRCMVLTGKKESKKGKEEETRCVKEKTVKEKWGISEKKNTYSEKEVEPKQEVNSKKRVNKSEKNQLSLKESDKNKKEAKGAQDEMQRKEQNEVKKIKESMLTIKKETKQMDSTTTTVEKVGTKINEKDENDDDDDDDNESFDLDLSDYDSDNDKLDLALEEWRNDCGGGKIVGEPTSPVKGGNRAKGRKGEGFRLWRKEQKESTDNVELSSALQALLDKATAAASMDSDRDSNSGWTM